MQVSAQHQHVFRELGIDSDAVFDHPRIVAWRSLSDRQNCTLDHGSGRYHVKRYFTRSPSAKEEVQAFRLLESAGIPTAQLVAWGSLADGRSFVITEDLAGYRAADVFLRNGGAFDEILKPTANLAARLHGAGLHHRDLYLAHFFVCPADVRLIDVARVARLPRFLANRWVVKDLAQFCYSTRQHSITDIQRSDWLDAYATARGTSLPASIRTAIERKADAIARHDARLRVDQPDRNISIPDSR